MRGTFTSEGRDRLREQDGMALILVISVLLVLTAIATPFVLSAKKDHRITSSASHRTRARALAHSAVDYARYMLQRSHQGVEFAGQGFGTPYWDAPSEFRVDAHPEAWREVISIPDDTRYLGDPKGDLWSIKVRDEQSWINADTAPPFVWGALIGRSQLTGDVTPDTKSLDLGSTDGFNPNGGSAVIGGELITYRKASDGRLLGVNIQGSYKAGEYVIDRFAFDLAMYNYKAPRANGRYTRFATETMIKEVAGYANRALTEDKLDDVLAPLTVHGHRMSAAGWLAPERIIAELSPDSYEPDKGQPVRVRNPDFFNPGTVVRVAASAQQQQVEYNIVLRSLRRGEEGVVYLLDPVSSTYEYGTATISAEMRHPVNINGATRGVLVLLLEGLEYNIATGPGDAMNRVSPELAGEVADVILKNRPVRGPRHFVELMKALYHVKLGTFSGGEEGGVSAGDVEVGGNAEMTFGMAMALVQNALNPNHRGLRQSTMPFRYVSHDYFTIEGLASVNDASGTELARHRVRETVKTAPTVPLVFRLDTQADFEEPIVAGRAGRYVETHPNPLAFFTAFTSKPEARLYRNMLHFDSPDRVGWFASDEEGDVRLQPARLSTVQNGDFEEHFDGDIGTKLGAGLGGRDTGVLGEDILPEGYSLRSRPYELSLVGGPNQGGGGQQQQGGGGQGQAGQPLSNPNSGVVADARGLTPFVLEFMVKPESFGSGANFLGIRGDTPEDYVRCWYDPGDKSFHLRVHDITLDDPNSPNQIEEAAEIVWTPDPSQIEDDTWYHLALHVGGTKPEDVSLHVDGFKVGESKFKSELQGGFNEDADSFTVEDATDWPDQGPFWVGTEVVEAYRTGPNSYRILSDDPNLNTSGPPRGRAQRGSGVGMPAGGLNHSPGESVRPFGYSALMTTAEGIVGEALTVGGGGLTGELGPFSVSSIRENATQSWGGGAGPNGMPLPSVTVEVWDPTVAGGQMELVPFPGDAGVGVEKAFPQGGGYAIVVTDVGGGGGIPQQVLNTVNPQLLRTAALIYYQSRNGMVLQGVSVPPFVNQELNNVQLNLGGGNMLQLQTGQLVAHVIKRAGQGSTQTPTLFTAIFPISIQVSNINGYKEPDEVLAFGGPNLGEAHPEFVQVGNPPQQPSYQQIDQLEIEWIRYYHRDAQNGHLLCDSRFRVQEAVDIVLAGLPRSASTTAIGPTAILIPNSPHALGTGNPYLTQGSVSWSELVNRELGFRNQAGTRSFGFCWADPGTHTAGTTVIPCFRVARAAAGGVRGPAGYGDGVTLISDVNQVKERHTICWAFEHEPYDAISGEVNEDHALATNEMDTRESIGHFCAFTDDVSTTILQGNFPAGGIDDRRKYARICKFPSGELPKCTANGSVAYLGADENGAIQGTGLLDEVRLRGLLGKRYVLWDYNQVNPIGGTPNPFPIGLEADSGATSIPIQEAEWVLSWTPPPANAIMTRFTDYRRIDNNTAPTGLPADAGIVLIDDELIVYRSIGTTSTGGVSLEDCIRGFMNTEIRAHSFGANITFLDWRVVTKLTGQMSDESWDIPVEDALGFAQHGGTVLINEEMMHYSRAVQGVLSMPSRVEAGTEEEKGIFRGRYGTRIGSHDGDDIVVDMPIRYWDRNVPECDDPELAYYEFTVNEPDAFFTKLAWAHRFVKTYIGLRVLCRLDPTVPWDTPPDRSGGRIVEFKSEPGQTQEKVNEAPLRTNGKGIEVRVFFTYEPNACDTTQMRVNSWKETPHLLNAVMTYIAAPRVLKRETLR